jgi:hypothetical protein
MWDYGFLPQFSQPGSHGSEIPHFEENATMPVVELSDGSTVLFLAPGAHGDFEAQGEIADHIKAKLSEIADRAGEVLLEVVNGVRSTLAHAKPSELEIEISVSLSKEGSIIISSAKAEASLTIKAVWKEGRQSND